MPRMQHANMKLSQGGGLLLPQRPAAGSVHVIVWPGNAWLTSPLL
jgi:hypothetical protein